MKKILLSCVTCLLALGLVTACDDEVEDVTPNEPETTVPSEDTGDGKGGDTSGTLPGGSEEEGAGTTLQFVEVSELVSGESYYFGYPNGEDYYFFNGSLYYTSALYCSENVEEALMVTVTGNDTEGWTLTYTGTDSEEYTIYCYLYTNTSTSSTSASITAVKTSELEGALNDDEEEGKSNATATFTWDSEHAGLTVMLGETACYVSTYAQYKEISLSKGNFDYAASHFYVDNPDYVEPEPEPVPEVVEPDLDNDDTYKLGVLDTTNAVYRYFNGTTTGSTFLATTTAWNDAAEVYITAQPNYTEENSCTLSTVVEDELKYISFDDSSTSVTLSDTPCVVVYDETYGVFALGHNLNTSGADRMLCLNTNYSDFRAYQGTSSSINGGYDLVTAYSTEPSLPAVETITVSGATTVEVGSTISLVATIEPKGASTEVTWSSDSAKATVDTNGVVTGITATEGEEVVTITATSTYTTSVSGSFEITVTEAEEEPENYVGTIDFTTYCSANANTNAFGASGGKSLQDCLNASYTGEGTITAGETSSAFPASNGSGDGLKGSKECIQLGGSSAAGYIEFSLKDNSQNDIEIATVVVKALAYDSNKTFTVNGVTGSPKDSTAYSTWDQVEEIELTITAASTIKVSSVTTNNGRILVHSIKLYTAAVA